MNITIINDYYNMVRKGDEFLFLDPDGTRTRFPIGWEGKGRYLPGTLRLYRASDNSLIDPATYSEESNGIFFNFTSAPAAGSYQDIKVKYLINPIDYAFSMGTSDSAYPGEEYFLFPNWNNAKGCGNAFWVGKYEASDDGTGTAISKKGNTTWSGLSINDKLNACNAKGAGFHCIRNREWVSIALWTDIMGITVQGNVNGSNNVNDIDGQGTKITDALEDSTGSYHKILTGTGPDTFSHNGKSDGIMDLSGNVNELIDGIRLNNGVVEVYDSDNTTWVALPTGSMNVPTGTIITAINNSTNDLLNEGLPVSSGGYTLKNTHPGILYSENTGIQIGYRSGGNGGGVDSGIWSLKLDNGNNIGPLREGFRLCRDFT